MDNATLDELEWKYRNDPITIVGAWDDRYMVRYIPELAKAVRDPARVRDLLAQGHSPVPVDLLEAISVGMQDEAAVKSVNLLLAAGIDPNSRPEWAHHDNAVDSDEWAHVDAHRPPVFYGDQEEWYALRLAASGRLKGPGDKLADLKDRMTRMQIALLQSGADIYSIYRQPMRIFRPFADFPGDDSDEEYLDEDIDLHLVCLERRNEHQSHPVGRDRYDPPYEAQFPRRYGQRSVIHAILEDGEFVQPLLDFFGDALELERRDPQGRTLLLAACRSALGADAAIDGITEDVRFDDRTQSVLHNPFPKSQSMAKLEAVGFTTTSATSTPSLFRYLVDHGANLLAVDNFGKNILHQLLESESDNDTRPPIVRASLRFVAARQPTLVNQPDNAGTMPLFAALKRLRYYPVDRPCTTAGELEALVDDLLEAGADPLSRDNRGNTPLHYLAADRIGEADRMGQEQRRLFQVFHARGVDLAARNDDGRRALDLFIMRKDDEREELRYPDGEPSDQVFEAIDEEVLGCFTESHIPLMEKTREGETILHVLVRQNTTRATSRFQFMVEHGLDPLVLDNDGRTALDIAEARQQEDGKTNPILSWWKNRAT